MKTTLITPQLEELLGMTAETAEQSQYWKERKKYFRQRAEMVSVPTYCGNIPVRERPYLNKTYRDVLQLRQKKIIPLSAIELEEVLKSVNPFDRKKNSIYIDLPYTSSVPSWTSHGMGVLFDPEGEAPKEYQGRFVVGSIGSVDEKTGRTCPDYEHAVVLTAEEVENLICRDFVGWRVDEKTGVSVPVLGKRVWSVEQSWGNRERLLQPFQPIMYQSGKKWKTLSPFERVNVWMRKKD